MDERQVEAAIRQYEEEVNAPVKEYDGAHQKLLLDYAVACPPPVLYDSNDGYGPLPELYPLIIAQVHGLVHVLRWVPWAAAYEDTTSRKEKYYVPEQLRFWMPMPEAIDPPEDFFDA